MKIIFNKYMKTSELILIFLIIGYCLTDSESFDCKKDFEEKLKKKNEEQCTKIDSCYYNRVEEKCIKTNDCGEGSNSNCGTIIPTNSFDLYKCGSVGGECQRILRECDDWGKLGNSGVEFENDDCTKLKVPSTFTSQNHYCNLKKTYGTYTCQPFYKSCNDIRDFSNTNDCLSNIPESPYQMCKLGGNSNELCVPVERFCDETSEIKVNKSLCINFKINSLNIDANKKKCIYDESNKICMEYYISCEERSASASYQCSSYSPLNQLGNDYDYTKKCTYDGLNKCKTIKRQCKNYNTPNTVPEDLINESFCNQLDVTEIYYRCAYDKVKKECYEEYKSCENYTNYKVKTDRDGCENIQLEDVNKKCVYDIKEDTCVEKQVEQIYQKCEDYPGKDKKTCESILSSESNLPFCVLDKDSKCIERPFLCSEAFTEEDCLHIAKASNDNKRCSWAYQDCSSSWCEPIRSINTCYEEYIRCEDYLGSGESTSTSITISENVCKNIILYNGNICKWESSRCRSNNKICEDANTEEECKLIAESGVSDSERKVCAWVGTQCIETYKYCSDYRCIKDTTNCINFCQNNIKPYDEEGKNLSIGFKCYYEDKVGCQKVKVECKDAKNNPLLCESYNDFIYDNNKTYCGFFEGKCREYYKRCEDVEFTSSTSNSVCTNNIVKDGNIYKLCEIIGGKCVEKTNCPISNIMTLNTPITPTSQPFNFYKDLCEKIHPNCSFTYEESDPSNYECKFTKKTCKETKFYVDEIGNQEICERMQASKPYKKCVLKEDKSGCEEIYKELSYSTSSTSYSESPDGNSQESSSVLITKGAYFILIFLCLLY